MRREGEQPSYLMNLPYVVSGPCESNCGVPELLDLQYCRAFKAVEGASWPCVLWTASDLIVTCTAAAL